MRIRWTENALADLQSISEYVERDRNLTTANRVCRSIYEAVQTLRVHPNKGRIAEQIDCRELVLPSLPYVVLYRVANDAVHVLRIWHGARDRPH